MATNGLSPVAAIVLTGGRSERMGVDKASLVVNGATMLDRTLDVLAAAGVSQIAIAGSAELPDPAGESLGPLAGIASGWAYLQDRSPGPLPDPVVVLSVDLPALSPDVVRELVETSRHHEHGAVAHDGERPQPLIAAYRRQALDELAAGFAGGERSVRRFFRDWDLAQVTSERATLVDADSPDDLAGFDVQWPKPKR